MAKTTKEATLTTATARRKLPTGLHWRSLDAEAHLGYRKGKRAGVWVLRFRDHYTSTGSNYRHVKIGPANDQNDDAVEGLLTYYQAESKARETVEQERRADRAAADGPPATVASAVESYISERDARDSKRAGRPIRSDAGQRLRRYMLGQDKRGRQPAILPAPLASVALHALKERDLIKWRAALPGSLKATTVQRMANDLKAALNAAWPRMPEGQRSLNPLLPAIIKAGLAAPRMDDDADSTARDNQILKPGQVAALIRAAREIDTEQEWGGDLFRLVLVLAATGARYAQIVRMTVGDVQVKQRRLMVPGSYKGRGGKIDFAPVPVGDDVIDALIPIVTGRIASAPLFERNRYEQLPGDFGKWQCVGRRIWYKSDLDRPWNDIRDRAGLPTVIPYALRHTSIVRLILTGLATLHVANRHNTSEAMIKSHYGKFISSEVEETERAAIVPLVPDDQGNVIHLHGGAV